MSCFKLMHSVQEMADVWDGHAAMIETALGCLEQLPFALFVIDDRVNVSYPFFVLVLGELYQEAPGVEDPAQDDLGFGWCAFS